MSPRRRVAGLLAGSANKPYSTLLYHRAPRRSRARSKVAISAEAEYTLLCIKSCHELEAACGAGLWIPATCPGSKSGTCFHSNRSSRLAPAHQGMKSRSCGSVQRIGTADSATPHPAPAGDKPLASRSLRPRYIFSFRHRPSVYNSARFAGGEPASRLIGGHIPDRSPGHAFVPISPAHQGMKIEAPVGGSDRHSCHPCRLSPRSRHTKV